MVMVMLVGANAASFVPESRGTDERMLWMDARDGSVTNIHVHDNQSRREHSVYVLYTPARRFSEHRLACFRWVGMKGLCGRTISNSIGRP